MPSTIRTSKLLEEIIKGRNKEDRMSIFEINALLHERGFGLLLILFSFPMAIPLPYPPGFTTVLGIPLIFYAIQMILRRKDAWLPNWVAKKTIKVEHLKFAINKSMKFFKFVEKIMQPRLEFITGLNGERVIGVFVFLCAICITLPIPLGNALPSLGIFIMSLGLLNKDGLIVILGMVVSIVGLAVATAVVVFGLKALTLLLVQFLPFFNFL